jgi:carboxypeptidase Taq
MGILAGVVHERAVDGRLERAIEAVEAEDADNAEARVMRRDVEYMTKLPNEFVREVSEATSLSVQAWQEARANDDFAGYAPTLQRVLDLYRQKAEYLGYDTEPYDALHDLYEEGSRAADLEPLFDGMRQPLHELVDAQPEPDVSILQRNYPIDRQEQYGPRLVQSMGYDLEAGRVDQTVQTIFITIGTNDVRLNTRY